jgi:dienelactone hydrolase
LTAGAAEQADHDALSAKLASVSVEQIEPTPLAVTVRDRRVPAALWQPHGHEAPLVLLGHGGSSHKTASRQQALAGRLVAAGMAVVAIDGPAHGERAQRPDMAPGEYQADLVARGVESVVRDMVADWRAAIAAARATGATDGRLGYLGLSMGTRFGLPLAAVLGEELTCAVLGKFGLSHSAALHPGLHDPTQLRRDAEHVMSPTMWHVQWDDELFPRVGQLEMFDCLGASDKQLVAFPGEHGTSAAAAVDGWIAFLVRHLPLAVADGPQLG